MSDKNTIKNILELESPKEQNSSTTTKKRDIISQISLLTGLQEKDIDNVFLAYNKIAVNNILQGKNVVLPYIGIIKVIRSLIPETYNKALLEKFGAIHIPNLNRKHRFTVMFIPRLSVSASFHAQTRDKLPINEDAIKVKHLPFVSNIPISGDINNIDTDMPDDGTS